MRNLIDVKKTAVNAEKTIEKMTYGVKEFAFESLGQDKNVLQFAAALFLQFAKQFGQYFVVFRHGHVQVFLKQGVSSADRSISVNFH